MKPTNISADPACAWCRIPIPVNGPMYSGIDPGAGLPTGVGVRVCSPGCPERPTSATVTRRQPQPPR